MNTPTHPRIIESHHRHLEVTKREEQPIIEVRIVIPNRYISSWLKEFSPYLGLVSKNGLWIVCGARLWVCVGLLSKFLCASLSIPSLPPFGLRSDRETCLPFFFEGVCACDSWQEWKFHQCSPYVFSFTRHTCVCVGRDWIFNVRIPMYNGNVMCLTASWFEGLQLQRLLYFMAQFSKIMQSGSIFG